ncbi:hypothetical protein Tco_1478243, partial [Tanacetum coccineum]
NIRVILFSIHSDDGNLSSVNIKQHCDYQDKDCQGRLLSRFQDDEHVGQDTRSQDGKDLKEKDLKISESKTKSKDNDKGSRSKITQHDEQAYNKDKDQDQDQDSRTQRQRNLKEPKIEGLKTLLLGRLLASKY